MASGGTSSEYLPPPQVEDLSKQLSDHEQASKAQQQKLKVRWQGMPALCPAGYMQILGVWG